MVLPGVVQEEALKPWNHLILGVSLKLGESMKWDSFIGFLLLGFSDPGRRGFAWPWIFVIPPKLFHFFPSPVSTPLKNQIISWKCHCTNKNLKTTLMRTLTYLFQEPTEKGSLCLGNSTWARNSNTSLKARAEMSTSDLKKEWKPVPPSLSWFCALGKISKGTTSTWRRQFEISTAIGTTVFPEVIKSLEMESYKSGNFILLGQCPWDPIMLKALQENVFFPPFFCSWWNTFHQMERCFYS